VLKPEIRSPKLEGRKKSEIRINPNSWEKSQRAEAAEFPRSLNNYAPALLSVTASSIQPDPPPYLERLGFELDRRVAKEPCCHSP
jgi:hypothetical protein